MGDEEGGGGVGEEGVEADDGEGADVGDCEGGVGDEELRHGEVDCGVGEEHCLGWEEEG